MKNNFLWLFLVLAATLFVSCSGESSTEPGTPANPDVPVITIISPVTGDSVAANGAMIVKIKIKAKKDLITKVKFLVDGLLNQELVGQGSIADTNRTLIWIAPATVGIHTFQVIAQAGSLESSASVANIRVTKPVNPDAPEISFISPVAGDSVIKGETMTVKIRMRAKKDLINRIKFLVDNYLVQELYGQSSIDDTVRTINWTAPTTVGVHSFKVIAQALDLENSATVNNIRVVNISSGSFLWAKRVGAENFDRGTAIVSDGNGNFYATGYFSGYVHFGSIDLSLYSAGYSDIYIAKLDADGNFLWAKRAGGTDYDEGKSIAVDANGNCYVTGYFNGSSASFGSTTLTSSSGSRATFITKLDADGNFLWAKKVAGTSSNEGESVAVDAEGNCYLSGSFQGSATFGTTTITSGGQRDAYIAKISPSGSFLWAKQIGGPDDQWGNVIDVDNSGNCYLCGDFGGTVSFGSISLTSSGSSDAYIAKIDAGGNFLWAKQTGGTARDGSGSLSFDNSGNCYLFGTFKGNATFGSTSLTSSGEEDLYVAKLNANGNFIWAKRAGGPNYEGSGSITTDNSGNCYISGGFRSTAVFGSTALTSAGFSDIFIAKLDASGNFLWAKQAGGVDEDYGIYIHADNDGYCSLTGSFEDTADFGSHSVTSAGGSDIFITKFKQ